MTKSTLLATALLALGCGGTDPVTEVSLPFRFDFTATATSGDTLDCRLAYEYRIDSETVRTDDRVEYVGTYGGEAFRSHLQTDGSGEQFWADVAGAFRAVRFANDSVELRYDGQPSDEHYRFWDAQLLFAGRMLGTSRAGGVWSCEPLDVRSDTTGIVAGTWEMSWTVTTASGR